MAIASLEVVVAVTTGCLFARAAFLMRLSDRLSVAYEKEAKRQENTVKTSIALVAQLVEHGTFNAGVLGSIPNERN
jgi:hypothetical protein